jgi:tetratricopeptide (TPR) repeat protein
MFRLMTIGLATILLAPAQAAAQQAMFVSGLAELTRAVMAVPADETRVRAALDRMDAGLARWPAPRPAVGILLPDNQPGPPVLPLAAYADGFSRLLTGEYSEAIGSFRRAAASRDDERERLVAAAELARQGRDADAERALRAIVTAYPASGMAHWWLARVYENLNRASDARREYEAAVVTALAGRAELYRTIGMLSRIEGDYVRAAGAFEQRLRLTPSDPAAHRDLASIHFEHGRPEQALAALRAAVALAPGDAEAHAGIGRLLLDAGQPGEAIASLQRALDLRPDQYQTRYSLAMALRQIGRDADAARELAIFDRAQREATESRRRTIATGVEKEDAARKNLAR